MRAPSAGGCTHGKAVVMAAVAFLAVFGAVAETRIGIIGLDTSHAVAFTKVINVDRPPWTEGFRVTAAYQWGSRDIVSSTNRYPEYIAKVREMGVAVVPTIDELIESVRGDRTFVMVSHDLAKGFAMCTHALVLARGRVVAFAPKDELDYGEFAALYRDTVGMGVA